MTRPEDARDARRAGAQRVYLDVIDFEPTEELLREVSLGYLVPMLDEVCRESDHDRLDPWVCPGASVLVGNVSELALARERGALPELRGCIPVHNLATLRAMAALGARFAWLSPELSVDEMRELAAGSPIPLGIVAYGRPRLMTCEHCVLQVAYDCDRDHARCAYRARRHWLVNIDGRRLPTTTDRLGRSRIYLDEPIDLVPMAAELAQMGMARLLVDARVLGREEALAAIDRLKVALAGGHVDAFGAAGLARTGVE